jgi:RNA polymerase sigma factor (sigma-70 family)
MVAQLLTLPPRQRAAIVLRYYVDLSEAQTAEVMGCSVGAVKSQVSTGLGRLRDRMGADLLTAPRGDETVSS